MKVETKETYLGDGVYASFDREAICLRAPREKESHYVFLEPALLKSLIQYAIGVGWLKDGQTIKKA